MIEYSENLGRITARVSEFKRDGSGCIAMAIQASGDTKEMALEKLYVISLLNLQEAQTISESVKKELK